MRQRQSCLDWVCEHLLAANCVSEKRRSYSHSNTVVEVLCSCSSAASGPGTPAVVERTKSPAVETPNTISTHQIKTLTLNLHSLCEVINQSKPAGRSELPK